MPPVTRYARNGDVHIAYQAFGEGAVDLLWIPQSVTHQAEHLWEHPSVARFFGRLAGFARVITFDRRGSGMSDRTAGMPTLEEQMDDVIAVLDAVGVERAGLLALLDGGAMAMLFAATHPERTRGLMLYATFARTTWAPDYDWAPTPEERRARTQVMVDNWGDGSLIEGFAPSHAGDRPLREWLGAHQRLAMGPSTARALLDFNEQLDVRSILPSIRVPTLVLHRRGDTAIDPRHSEYLARAIPDAELRWLEGSDNLPFVGDAESVIGEIEEFLTGARSTARDRVLATVLLSDIVRSTERAAELGDRRWRDLLAGFGDDARRAVAAFHGRAVKSTGDGLLATFDGPARAIRAGRLLVEEAGRRDLELRVGLHTGEVEVMGDDLGGLAVHIAARVMGEARPGEVLVSGTVKDLVVGSGMSFEDRGVHRLRGVPDEWRLWTVA